MDPLSIASASGSLAVLCVRVATTIYDINSSIQNVDDNLSGLRQELLGLSGVLEGIQNTWKKNHDRLVAYSGADANLWSSISDNVNSGRETVAKLEIVFGKLNKSTSFSNSFLRKPVKAFKLSLSADDISQFRQRINSHQLAMQSGLQMLILCLQIQETTSTHNVDNSLSTLGTMIAAITQRLETLTVNFTKPDSSTAAAQLPANDGVISSLETMAEAAKSLYSSASTVIEGKRSTIYDGSILGDPLTEDQLKSIQDWIPPTKDDLPENGMAGAAGAGDSNGVQNGTKTTSTTPASAPSNNTDFLGRAIDTVKRAIEYDNDAEYQKAYERYYSALELFMLAMKWEKNPQSKALIRQKTGEYMERAEKLKNYLSGESSYKGSGSGSGSGSSLKFSMKSSSVATSSSSTTTLVATRLPSNPGTPHIMPPDTVTSSKMFVSYIADAEDIVGVENVQIITSNDVICRNMSKALESLSVPPRANLFLSVIVSPRNSEDVRQLLRLFHRVKIPVWPFYPANEADYRLAIPRVPGSVGLNMTKCMNKVVEVNEEQLYAVVEPGVSYSALVSEITKRGLDERFWIDWPVSSKALVVEQVLEEGGVQKSSGMEIVLPQGAILKTGILNPSEERGKPKDRTLEQSLANGVVSVQCLGVVTKTVINLRPKKSKCQPFLITFSKNDDLPRIIDIAHELRQTGLITHDMRLRQILLDSSILPRDSQSTPTTHTPSSLAQELELDYWNLYGVLSQPGQIRPAIWTAIKSSFNEVEGVKFYLLDESSSPKFTRHVTDRSSPRFSASTDTHDMMTSHAFNNSSIMCIMCTQSSRIITGITATKMHQISGKNCLKAKQTPLTEFVITETALHQNTHIQFSTNYSNIGKNILNLMQGMLNDCISNGWENFNTHPFLMDRMNSVLRSWSENGTGGESESESEFWSREIVLAVKNVVDKNGILAPGRFGVWSRFAFRDGWDVVVDDDDEV